MGMRAHEETIWLVQKCRNPHWPPSSSRCRREGGNNAWLNPDKRRERIPEGGMIGLLHVSEMEVYGGGR
jgi:hypothetical protein